ncbi:MAG: photosynthetic complex assembly protein PuhC [Myxococcota bacterium]
MSDPFKGQAFPKGVLYGSAALIAVVAALVWFGRATDIGTVHMPEASAVQSRDVLFTDEQDGAVIARDAGTGARLVRFEPGTAGFVRGVLRGLVRERKLEGMGQNVPFRLTRWSDGRMSIRDTATGRVVELDAFGPTNAKSFAGILMAAQDAGANVAPSEFGPGSDPSKEEE